jgi:hypothetical protein
VIDDIVGVFHLPQVRAFMLLLPAQLFAYLFLQILWLWKFLVPIRDARRLLSGTCSPCANAEQTLNIFTDYQVKMSKQVCTVNHEVSPRGSREFETTTCGSCAAHSPYVFYFRYTPDRRI